MVSRPAGPKARSEAMAERATFVFEETASCASWAAKSSEALRLEVKAARDLESGSENSAARTGAVRPSANTTRNRCVFMAVTSHEGWKELSGPGKRNVKQL